MAGIVDVLANLRANLAKAKAGTLPIATPVTPPTISIPINIPIPSVPINIPTVSTPINPTNIIPGENPDALQIPVPLLANNIDVNTFLTREPSNPISCPVRRMPTNVIRPRECVDNPGMSLDQMFLLAANQFNFDWKLLKAIAIKESSLGQNPISRGSSFGVMQINVSRLANPDLDIIARELGITYNVRDPNNLIIHCLDNIRLGARILHDNLNRRGQDAALALAEYNAGKPAAFHPIPPMVSGENPLQYVLDVAAFYQKLGGDTSTWQIP